MDPPSQQQPETDAADEDTNRAEADRVALRAEIRTYLDELVQTTRCFEVFRKDMQAAVNALSQYDAKLYVDVTRRCNSLKDTMSDAAARSATVVECEQDNPDRTRHHMRLMRRVVNQLRGFRDRVAEVYLRWTVCESPKLLELENNLDFDFSLLRHYVQGVFSYANGHDYDWGFRYPSEQQGSTPPEGWLRRET